MYSFNNWSKLSAEYWSQSSSDVSLSSKFGVAVNYISEPIAERITSYLCTCPHTNDDIPQAECCWEKTGKSLLYLDVNNKDNILNHVREVDIGESMYFPRSRWWTPCF